MSTGHGRVQRDLLKWFQDQPAGTEAGTSYLALLLRHGRESVYRALLRLEEEGEVRRIYYRDGGLGLMHQRMWEMVPERWEAQQRFRRAVARGIEVLEANPDLRR